MKKLNLREIIDILLIAEQKCGSNAEVNIAIQSDHIIHDIYDVLYDERGVTIYNY